VDDALDGPNYEIDEYRRLTDGDRPDRRKNQKPTVRIFSA
jgi:hypothetical protein